MPLDFGWGRRNVRGSVPNASPESQETYPEKSGFFSAWKREAIALLFLSFCASSPRIEVHSARFATACCRFQSETNYLSFYGPRLRKFEDLGCRWWKHHRNCHGYDWSGCPVS